MISIEESITNNMFFQLEIKFYLSTKHTFFRKHDVNTTKLCNLRLEMLITIKHIIDPEMVLWVR